MTWHPLIIQGWTIIPTASWRSLILHTNNIKLTLIIHSTIQSHSQRHDMTLEVGCKSRVEGVRVICMSEGRGCGSKGAWPPPNTYRGRGVTVSTLNQPYNNVAKIKSVKTTIRRWSYTWMMVLKPQSPLCTTHKPIDRTVIFNLKSELTS